MHEASWSVLTPWANFYVITGSSAAALTGLMFVVITLVAGDRSRTTSDGISVFSSPTVVHFCVALLVSAILSAPWHTLVHPGVMLGLTGLYGVGYSLLVAHRMMFRIGRQATYLPQLEDWLWYAVVPLCGYVAIVAAAIWLPGAPTGALFALAGATVLLIFMGIHNAWDVVTFIAIVKVPERNAASAGDPATRSEQPPEAS